MRLKASQILCLALTASLLLVSGCGGRAQLLSPPLADLRVEPKPQLDPAALGSDEALTRYDIAIELWGERGWAAVARLCRWHARLGADVECPPPPTSVGPAP